MLTRRSRPTPNRRACADVIPLMAIRTNVTLRTDRFSMGDDAKDCDQLPGQDTAVWLIEQLPQFGFKVRTEPIQEDWGWVVRTSIGSARFWVGTSPTFEDGNPPEWIIHLHHWDFAFVQRFTSSGRAAFVALARAINQMLNSCPEFTEVRWHFENDLRRNRYQFGARTPETDNQAEHPER